MSLLLLPGFVINAIILSWIFKIEKNCPCSDDWRREYIKYYLIVGYILGLFIFMTKNIKFGVALTPITLGALVTYYYAVLTYIPMLHKTRCDCATQGDWRDNFIFWLVSASLIIIGLSFLVGVGAFAYLKSQ